MQSFLIRLNSNTHTKNERKKNEAKSFSIWEVYFIQLDVRIKGMLSKMVRAIWIKNA